mgnify:CR=1 FL=1
MKKPPEGGFVDLGRFLAFVFAEQNTFIASAQLADQETHPSLAENPFHHALFC